MSSLKVLESNFRASRKKSENSGKLPFVPPKWANFGRFGRCGGQPNWKNDDSGAKPPLNGTEKVYHFARSVAF